jgi:glycerol uptake facilitator-like aquaporin
VRIGLSDALLDGAGPPLRALTRELDEQHRRPVDAGDLLVLLAHVPGGLAGALAALGIDTETLAHAIEEVWSGGARSRLLPSPPSRRSARRYVARRWRQSKRTTSYVLVVAQGVGLGQAFVVEALITFVLVFVVVLVASNPRVPSAQIAAIAVGFALAAAVFVGGPLTGGGVNPARALGPMIVAGEFGDV